MPRFDTESVKTVHDLLVLFSSKAAFKLPEYEKVGNLFTRLEGAVADKQDVDVEVADVKFVVAIIDICSQRTPVGSENFRVVADLRDRLVELAKQCEDEEETKTEL